MTEKMRARLENAHARVFDYKKNMLPDDPTQDELANVLAQSFNKKVGVDFQWLALTFIRARNNACFDMWSAAKQIKDLQSLKKSIKKVGEIYNSLPQTLQTSILFAATKSIEIDGEDLLTREEEATQVLLEKLVMRDSTGLQGYDALQVMARYYSDLIPAIDEAIEEARNGVSVGNKAIDAWRLVEACDYICCSHSGHISVPKYMNSSGDFYRLVRDVFFLFGVDNDPGDIFTSWRKHVGKIEK